MEYIAKLDMELLLGKQGENKAVTVLFPIAKITEEYGRKGAFQLLNQRAGDKEPYPVKTEEDQNYVYWTVAAADVERAGIGKAELQYRNGTTVYKSMTWRTRVEAALGEAGEAPEPQKAWVDEVLETAAEMERDYGKLQADMAAGRFRGKDGEPGVIISATEPTGADRGKLWLNTSETGTAINAYLEGDTLVIDRAGASVALYIYDNSDDTYKQIQAIKGKDGVDGAHTWDELEGKPTTFTPSPHQHTQNDVSGLVAALANKSDSNHTHTAEEVSFDAEAEYQDGTVGSGLTTAFGEIANKEDSANRVDSIVGNESDTGKYPSAKAVADYTPINLSNTFVGNASSTGWSTSNITIDFTVKDIEDAIRNGLNFLIRFKCGAGYYVFTCCNDDGTYYYFSGTSESGYACYLRIRKSDKALYCARIGIANYYEGRCGIQATITGKTAVSGGVGNYSLANATGQEVRVMWYYGNTATSNVTFNWNSQGAKPLYLNGSPISADNYKISVGVWPMYYDGTNWYIRTDGLPVKPEYTAAEQKEYCEKIGAVREYTLLTTIETTSDETAITINGLAGKNDIKIVAFFPNTSTTNSGLYVGRKSGDFDFCYLESTAITASKKTVAYININRYSDFIETFASYGVQTYYNGSLLNGGVSKAYINDCKNVTSLVNFDTVVLKPSTSSVAIPSGTKIKVYTR